MLCTEDCCKAALLEALLFSRINNAVKLHAVAELAWTDACKHMQMRVCGYRHSSPYSLLWLNCAQYQLFAAFTLFLLLEVKYHIFLLPAHHEASPQAGDILAEAETLRPGPGSNFCPGRRKDGHKNAKGSLEGGLYFLESHLICLNKMFSMPRLIVLSVGRKCFVNIMYRFCLSLRFPGHFSLLSLPSHWKQSNSLLLYFVLIL